MALVSLLLYFITAYRIWFLTLLGALVAGLIWRRRPGTRQLLALLSATAVLVLLVLLLGPRLNSWFLYRYGTPGQALVTRTDTTEARHNRRLVVRYHTQLRRPNAPVAEVTFKSNRFSAYPLSSGVGDAYPVPGQPFSVRFVPGAEPNFVIVANAAGSPLVRRRSCPELLRRISQIAKQYDADSTNLALNRQYAAAIREYLHGECTSPFLSRFYNEQQKRLTGQAARAAAAR
jgi:hypothetical protein